MFGTNIDPMARWPKVRFVKPGIVLVKGRCITTGQWLVLRLSAFLLVLVLIASLLSAAMLPWVSSLGLYIGDAWLFTRWMELLAAFRWWSRSLFDSEHVVAGQAIGYAGTSPIDWPLLGLCVLLFWLRRPLRYMAAAGLAFFLGPFIGRGFKVSFTRESVTIHRWLGLGTTRLFRRAVSSDEVMFRAAMPHHQTGLLRMLMRMKLLRPGQDDEMVLVQAIVGLRPVKIITPRKILDAEKIVQSLTLALKSSRDSLDK